jgi:Flp pilus assembly protein TadB
MTILMFIIGVLLISVSGRLAAHAISVPRVQLRRHLHDIGDYGFAAEPESAAGQVTSRGQLNDAFAAYADRVGRFAIAYLPALRPLKRGELAAASFYESTPEAVHGYRAFAAIFLATLVALLAAMTGGVSLLTVVLMVALAAAGWQLPAVVIRSRGKARLKQVDKELPELIDLLIATVEAGMAFSASLVLVSTRIQGPLGDEVRLAIRHQDLGISTSEALEDMLERCDTPSMHAFVRTVTRGESMGLSISPILRELATDIRRRRRQAAQEKMHKAPVKMLFPTMFLIMPVLMIVLFYPAAYQVMTGLSHVG